MGRLTSKEMTFDISEFTILVSDEASLISLEVFKTFAGHLLYLHGHLLQRT